MRSLSTLATLLLGLAVVFWAPAAKADCPHNNDDTHQHCVGGTSTNSGPIQFVGYSSTSVSGDAGLQEIYETCQDDFGLGARMCSGIEFYYSPNATAPAAEAWVTFDENPNNVAIPCDYWTSPGSVNGTILQNSSGKVRLRDTTVCTSVLPVTCCSPIQ